MPLNWKLSPVDRQGNYLSQYSQLPFNWNVKTFALEEGVGAWRVSTFNVWRVFTGHVFHSYCFKQFVEYLLTAWCRVLLEKLTGLQLVKKFPAFHGTRKFITALTSLRQLSLYWASPIQSIYPHPTSWRYILILSIHLRLGLPSGLFPSGFPSKTLYTPLYSPIRATCPVEYEIKLRKMFFKRSGSISPSIQFFLMSHLE